MDTIKAFTNDTTTLLLTHKEWGGGIHGGRLSTTMHNELISLIHASRNYSEYMHKMGRFTNRWVTAGRYVYPVEFQDVLKKFE
jgi:hypothetical protein